MLVCTSVCLSHAAARSTMVDISCRALSVRVEMASRSHSLMSVTTWSTQTHAARSVHTSSASPYTGLTHRLHLQIQFRSLQFDVVKSYLVVSAPASVQLPCRYSNQLLKRQPVRGLQHLSSQPSASIQGCMFTAHDSHNKTIKLSMSSWFIALPKALCDADALKIWLLLLCFLPSCQQIPR